MNWKLIIKDPSTQPRTGSPRDWKQQIADECYHQCVYCAIKARPWGGLDNFHIEHYRPASRFKKFRKDICNLFLACPICNRFKSNDWPAEPDSLDTISYPNPSVVDYSTILNIDPITYRLESKYKAAEYIIHRLFLNRPQLILERREALLLRKELELSIAVIKLSIQVNNEELSNRSSALQLEIREHIYQREFINPYSLAQIRRP